LTAPGAENILATVAPPGTSRKLDDYIDMSLIDGLRAEGSSPRSRRNTRAMRIAEPAVSVCHAAGSRDAAGKRGGAGAGRRAMW